MKKAKLLFTSATSLLMASVAFGAAYASEEKLSAGDARKEIAITIYNQDLALVRELRELELEKGLNRFALRDVSGNIKPETAIITALDNSKINLLEQNFNFDLLTPDSLMDKYVGKEVSVIRTNRDGSETTQKATILSNNAGLVMKYDDRIEIGLPKDARIKFDTLPKNLRDRPTLVTSIASESAGKKAVNLSYLSAGFSWQADYVAELNKEENKISLKGWVTLQNNSGTDYQNAKLQLVAGDVNVVMPRVAASMARLMNAKEYSSDMPIQEEGLLDYHLYTLPNSTTLNNNQIKQVALMNADNVPVKKQYISQVLKNIYETDLNDNENGQSVNVSVYFDFVNNKDSNLGIPLPKGVLRAYKGDSKGNALFIGEDSIAHTSDNEHVRVKFGNAFDVKVFAKSLEVNKIGVDSNQSPIHEVTNQIIVKNAKDEAVEVMLPVNFYGNWEILQETLPHEKINDRQAVWKVKVNPKSDVKFTYKARTSY